MPQASNPVLEWIEKSQKLEDSGEIAAALQAAMRAVELAQAARDRAGLASALVQQGYIEFRLGHYHQAQALAEHSLELSDAYAHARADAWLILGNAAAETNSLQTAEDCYYHAADVSRAVGYTYIRMRSQHNLAMGVYFPRGLFDLALTAAQEAYTLSTQSGFPDYVIFPLTTLAWIYQITGQQTQARQMLESLKNAYRPGTLHEGYYCFLSAELALDQGDLDRAPALYQQAISVALAIGEPGLNVQARVGMSRYYYLAGNYVLARDWAADALKYAGRAGYAHMQGLAQIELGRAAWLAGDPAAAEENLLQSVSTLQELNASYDLCKARLVLAALYQHQKNPGAQAVWQETCDAILSRGFSFLAERESRLVYPLAAGALGQPDERVKQASAQLLERLNRLPPTPLKVVTLGSYQVSQGRRQISIRELKQRRCGELLALLLFSPAHRLTIEQVIESLWPDSDPIYTSRMLHHATSSLRHLLEPDLPNRLPSRYLTVEEGEVSLNLPPGSQVDFDEFERCCQQGNWEAALTWFGGEFLPIYLYSDWTVVFRQRAGTWAQSGLSAVAEKRLAEGRFTEALDFSQRLLELEPWHEPAVMVAMRAYQGLNNPAGALRLFRRLEKTLKSELDAAPDAALQALAKELAQKKR